MDIIFVFIAFQACVLFVHVLKFDKAVCIDCCYTCILEYITFSCDHESFDLFLYLLIKTTCLTFGFSRMLCIIFSCCWGSDKALTKVTIQLSSLKYYKQILSFYWKFKIEVDKLHIYFKNKYLTYMGFIYKYSLLS